MRRLIRLYIMTRKDRRRLKGDFGGRTSVLAKPKANGCYGPARRAARGRWRRPRCTALGNRIDEDLSRMHWYPSGSEVIAYFPFVVRSHANELLRRPTLVPARIRRFRSHNLINCCASHVRTHQSCISVYVEVYNIQYPYYIQWRCTNHSCKYINITRGLRL